MERTSSARGRSAWALMTIIPCLASVAAAQATIDKTQVSRPQRVIPSAQPIGRAVRDRMPLGANLPAGPALYTPASSPLVAIGWAPATDATGYLVARADANGVETALTPNPITETGYYDLSDLVPGQTYFYRVRTVYPTITSLPSQVTYTPPAPVGPGWLTVEWVPSELDSRGSFTLKWQRHMGVDFNYRVTEKLLNGVLISDFYAMDSQSALDNNTSSIGLSNPVGPGIYVFSVTGCYRQNVCTSAATAPRDTVIVP